MVNKEYALIMARYNLWQNENLYSAANVLSDNNRRINRGAFFRSIQETFSHLLWADKIWISRFSDAPPPNGGIKESAILFQDWDTLTKERIRFDQFILDWSYNVTPEWFEGELTWFSGAIGREITKPKKILVIQLFNHQTHHRGQLHAMLTSAGASLGDTDIPLMPDQYQL